MLNKQFPKHSKLHKIFNKNNVKVSYSCMQNMACIIKSHNKNITTQTTENTTKSCDCRDKENCPLKGNCQETSIIYNAEVIPKTTPTNPTYALDWQNTHARSDFPTTSIPSDTKNTKTAQNFPSTSEVWKIETKNMTSLGQSQTMPPPIPTKGREKLSIIKANKSSLLNKTSELISKCRHENKYYLKNFK